MLIFLIQFYLPLLSIFILGPKNELMFTVHAINVGYCWSSMTSTLQETKIYLYSSLSIFFKQLVI